MIQFLDKFFIFLSILLNVRIIANSTTTVTPSINAITGVFTLPVRNGILPLGVTVLMYCSSNNISANITWSKSNLIVSPSARYSIIKYFKEDSVLISLLKIENLIPTDYGTYSCLSSQINISQSKILLMTLTK